ncbi:MAG: hypothetical protein ACHQ49_16240 [Elusimicrobiota bacterium]
MQSRGTRRGAYAALACAFLLRSLPLRAQTSGTDGQIMGTKEDRILWFFPNYRTVDEEKSLPRITAHEKLWIATKDSFDPFSFPVAGLFAGIGQAENQEPGWGRGADGYGKRYVAALADQTMSNMMAEAAFPIMLRQDPRYLRLGRGGFLHRAGYAASRIFVTRADSGEAVFNSSEFGGNAVMACASNVYYPAANRTIGDTAGRFGTQIAFDMIADVSKEFWPDIKGWLIGN